MSLHSEIVRERHISASIEVGILRAAKIAELGSPEAYSDYLSERSKGVEKRHFPEGGKSVSRFCAKVSPRHVDYGRTIRGEWRATEAEAVADAEALPEPWFDLAAEQAEVERLKTTAHYASARAAAFATA